jgi:hypothetical protein
MVRRNRLIHKLIDLTAASTPAFRHPKHPIGPKPEDRNPKATLPPRCAFRRPEGPRVHALEGLLARAKLSKLAPRG